MDLYISCRERKSGKSFLENSAIWGLSWVYILGHFKLVCFSDLLFVPIGNKFLYQLESFLSFRFTEGRLCSLYLSVTFMSLSMERSNCQTMLALYTLT